MCQSLVIKLWSADKLDISIYFQCEEFKIQADAVKEGLVETYPVPCDVVRNSDIIFSCLSGPRASKDVSIVV